MPTKAQVVSIFAVFLWRNHFVVSFGVGLDILDGVNCFFHVYIFFQAGLEKKAPGL